MYVCISLAVTSCNNDAKTPESAKSETRHDPANPKNPYDFVGKLHNEALAQVRDSCSKIANLSITGRFSISNDISASILSTNPITRNSFYPSSIEYLSEEDVILIIQSLIDDPINNFENQINALSISEISKTELRNIFREVIAIASSPELAEYEDVHEKITDIENNIIDGQTIPENEMSTVLGCTSTLRHSVAYWESVSDHDLYTKARGVKWWRYLLVGAIDAAGAFIGSASPMGGPVIGSICGAIVFSDIAATYLIH